MEDYRYPFFVIEGCDQTGKSTLQQNLTTSIYNSHEILMERLNFPDTRTKIGQLLRLYLKGELELEGCVAHHLFSANRWESFEFILNALIYTPIICDRYVASGRAYSIAQGNLSLDWCKQFDVGLPKPDLTIYLENNQFKKPTQPNYEESRFDNSDLQHQIKTAFESLRGQDDERWITIQTDGLTPQMVLEQAVPHVERTIALLKDQDFPLCHYS